MKILVVDDAQDIVEIVKFVLLKQGHQVITALSGADAIAALGEGLPDILFVDYYLQDMQGQQILAEVNQRAGKQVKAILMTGLGEGEMGGAA